MSRVGDFLRKVTARKLSSVKQEGPGTIYLKPSEAKPSTIKSITSSGITASVVSGSVDSPKVTSYVSSGGGGSSSTSASKVNIIQQQLQAAQQRQTELERQERLRQEEAKKAQIRNQILQNQILQERLRQESIAQAELKRIEDQRRRIINSGGQKDVRILRDGNTGDRIQITNTNIDKINRGVVNRQRVFEVKNLDTGETVIKTYERDKNTGRSIQTGGIVTKETKELGFSQADPEDKRTGLQKAADKVAEKTIKVDLDRNKLRELTTFANSKFKDFLPFGKEFKESSFKDFKNRLKLGGLAVTKTALSNAEGALFIAEILTNKGTRKETGKAVKLIIVDKAARQKFGENIKSEGNKFVNLIRVSPGEALLQLGGELLLLNGTKKGFKIVKKAGKGTINKLLNLNPRLLKVEKGIIQVRKVLPSGKKIDLKVGGIKEVKESLAKQLKREGKSVVAVSAQANQLVSFLKRKAIIRKPFPFDEKKLSKVTRDLLNKFDKRKITRNEIIELNLRLRKETKRLGVQQKGIDLLERSTYFDPDRTLRKSRLAIRAEEIVEEGNFFDLITGRASLFKKKARPKRPQIIVLEDLVERIPRTKEFNSIIRKIKASRIAGKDPNLTAKELASLTRFQVTPSGKLKPIGSTTYQGGLERELTISPGEAIKRVRKLGTLKIGNKRIPIVAVRIIKGKQNLQVVRRVEKLKKQISKIKDTKKSIQTKRTAKNLNKKLDDQLKELNRKLENIRTKKATKEVREFIKERRRISRPKKKKFPLGRKTLGNVRTATRRPKSRTVRRRPTTRKTRGRKGVTPRRPTPRRPTRKRTPVRPRVPTRPTPRRPTPRRPTPRPPTPPTRGTSKPPFRRPKGQKRKPTSTRGGIKGYNVYVKSGKRFIKANQIPLSRVNAENRASYVVDHSTSVTAKIRPARNVRKVGKIKSREVGARSKIKARGYRIVKGRRVAIPDTIIEKKGKPRINTRGEKRGLSAAKLVKQLNKKTVKKKTKKKK